jgi:FAD synthase
VVGGLGHAHKCDLAGQLEVARVTTQEGDESEAEMSRQAMGSGDFQQEKNLLSYLHVITPRVVRHIAP